MAGKKIRSRTSQNSISVSSLSNRPVNVSNSNNIPKPRPNEEVLLGMSKDQLKTECRKRGQKTTGNKTELLQRLGCRMANVGNAKRKDATAGANAPTTNGTAHLPSNDVRGASGDLAEKARKEKYKAERESLVLWKRPLTTLEYFCREIVELLTTYGRKILEQKSIVLLLSVLMLLSYFLVNTSGPHDDIVQKIYAKLRWCLYWICLGVLSSVGFGTGLHTFLLYLGPHIAQVTLAAYECGSLNFPEPPYPDEIICPDERNAVAVSIFSIMSKVRLEAMCWGAGTALGELPPYFMARAARLSGIDPDDEDDDLKEFEELQRKKNRNDLTWIEKGKLFIEELVQRVGFAGILLCASIPNPLFDLAGITCGHFLVPFWTFFGATLIGKAIFKMHLQKLAVIVTFSETLLEMVLKWLELVPLVGEPLKSWCEAYLASEKKKLHRVKTHGAAPVGESNNIISWLFEKLVFVMIMYFLLSIVNSLAQSYHKRIHQKKTAKASKD